MEIANLWSQLVGTLEVDVRPAEQGEAGAITQLLREAPFSHIHADWHFPSDWMGIPSFVVVHRSDSAVKSALPPSGWPGHRQALKGCLAVAADPPPAAWVRLAAVDNRTEGKELLAAMFSAVLPVLREQAISQIAWLLVEEWPQSWLPDLEFEQINEVVTYSRIGSSAPRVSSPEGIEIRSADTADLPALAAIEARAFEPLWRHSEIGLRLGMQQSLSFDVAWAGNSPVGFQFSSETRRGAHLSRITVDPDAQNSGVGSALLAHAIEGYAQRGLMTITLNTQIDNLPSQKLYERFGFSRNGESFPVWSVQL